MAGPCGWKNSLYEGLVPLCCLLLLPFWSGLSWCSCPEARCFRCCNSQFGVACAAYLRRPTCAVVALAQYVVVVHCFVGYECDCYCELCTVSRSSKSCAWSGMTLNYR
eukprot:1878932-Amphidinium_carterae.1